MSDELSPPLDGRPLKAGHPEYDRKLRTGLDQRVKRIRSRSSRAQEDLWWMASDYLWVRDTKAHRQDGFGGVTEWVQKVLDMDPGTLKRWGRVAEHFSLVQLRKHGQGKLLAVLDYASLTLDGEDDEQAWSLETLELTLPNRPAGAPPLTAAKATREDVVRAVEHQKALALRRLRESSDGRFWDALESSLVAEERPLVQVRRRPAKSGHPHDDRITLDLRAGDLPSVAHRLLEYLSRNDLPSLPPPKKRGRG